MPCKWDGQLSAYPPKGFPSRYGHAFHGFIGKSECKLVRNKALRRLQVVFDTL